LCVVYQPETWTRYCLANRLVATEKRLKGIWENTTRRQQKIVWEGVTKWIWADEEKRKKGQGRRAGGAVWSKELVLLEFEQKSGTTLRSAWGRKRQERQRAVDWKKRKKKGRPFRGRVRARTETYRHRIPNKRIG